jgi:glycosyltransferase involved in cell wall biosynthesis
MADNTISVIMPAYNGERFIADALRSLQAETDIDLEIVVVDDGSTDRTAAVVADIACRDPRVRMVGGPHRGVAAARNAGLAATRGALIAFLDCDDVSVAGRLSRQAGYLAGHAEMAGVIGDVFEVREVTADLQPGPGSRRWRRTIIFLGAAMLRRSLFDRYGRFDEALAYGEDADLYMRLWEHDVPIHFDGEVAALYRRHETNMTNDRAETRRWFLHCIQRSIARRRALGLANLTIPEPFTRRLQTDDLLDSA